MIELRISDPLHHHLAKKRPIHIIGGIHHDEHEALRTNTVPDFILPPLNTHINFLEYTRAYTDKDHLDLHLKYTVNALEIPEVYDWRYVYSYDDDNRKNQKRYIMPPDDQYLCGSCWAISTASVIGDAFVVAGLVNWRPEISTTWALSCYPQGKCDGGSPALLLQDIAKGSGIPSKHCVDYSFCATNNKCNGQAVLHFDAENLSSLVPKECGCYYGGPTTPHFNYVINDDIKTMAIGQGATTSFNIKTAIKKHILIHGPVLTGFFVLKNFSSGNFTKINGGVYLERANYIPGYPLTFSDNEISGENYKGSHAVAIIGWGIAKNIMYDNDKRGDVPYWYCRNSWGSKWGDAGYFKMAMYPFNKVAQFEKIVDIVDIEGQRHRCGGIVTFTVSQPPQKTVFETLDQKPPHLLHKEEYYKEDGIPPPSEPPKPDKDYFPAQGTLLLLLLILFVLLIIVR